MHCIGHALFQESANCSQKAYDASQFTVWRLRLGFVGILLLGSNAITSKAEAVKWLSYRNTDRKGGRLGANAMDMLGIP